MSESTQAALTRIEAGHRPQSASESGGIPSISPSPVLRLSLTPTGTTASQKQETVAGDPLAMTRTSMQLDSSCSTVAYYFQDGLKAISCAVPRPFLNLQRRPAGLYNAPCW